MPLLELYPGSVPCVRSGFCCKRSACAFGEYDHEKQQCKFLETGGDGRYQCGKFDEIVDAPFAEINPAFGAGCCMPLFNEDRQRIIERMRSVVDIERGDH